MAARPQHFEELPKEQLGQPFVDSLPPTPSQVAPFPSATVDAALSSPVEPAPADFFLSCLSSVEQQQFLNFCAMRQLSPEAGVLAFLKEKLQRSELQSVGSNPFTDEAQAVVDSMRQPSPVGQAVRLGQKPVKPCEVCGQPVVVDFLGRMLCKNPQCWHTFAGLTPQEQTVAREGSGSVTDRRLSKLEDMMERIAGTLDRLVSA